MQLARGVSFKFLPGIGIWLGRFENGLSKSIFISDNNVFLHSMFDDNDEQEAHVNVARASDDVFS